MGSFALFQVLAAVASICDGFSGPFSPEDHDEWKWRPAWIPPPHFAKPFGDSLNVRLQMPFVEEELEMSPKADLLPFQKALDRIHVSAGLEEHNEVVEEELWKLFELNSENERTEDDGGYIFDAVNHNIQRPISKREKLFQLLQTLPGQE